MPNKCKRAKKGYLDQDEEDEERLEQGVMEEREDGLESKRRKNYTVKEKEALQKLL